MLGCDIDFESGDLGLAVFSLDMPLALSEELRALCVMMDELFYLFSASFASTVRTSCTKSLNYLSIPLFLGHVDMKSLTA